MRQVPHPLVQRDVDGIYDHVLRTTRMDFGAADRRLAEIGALLDDIARNPASGVRLSGPLAGWLVRHGGRDRRVTVVFRADPRVASLYIALIAFGGRNWLSEAEERSGFGGPG